MIYVIDFLTAILLIYVGEKLYAKNKYVGNLIMLIAILIPTILAGCRDTSVGTDTGAYVYYNEVIIGETSLFGAYTNAYLARVGLEPGFILLNWILGLFTENSYMILGVMAFLTNLLILCGARKYKEQYPTWLIMLIYYFVFAPVTFNIARQGLANAIIFSGARLLEDKKYKRFICVIVLASSIHFTAIIGGSLLLAMTLYLNKNKSIKRTFLLIVAVSMGIAFYKIPMNILLKIIPSYSGYVEMYASSEVQVSLLSLLLKAPMMVMATLWYKQIDSVNDKYHVYYTYLWMDLLISQFGAFLGPLERLAYYFAYYQMLILPSLCISYGEIKNDERSIANKRIAIVITIIWVLSYWYIYTVDNMYGFTLPVYPYTSKILNIY